MCGAIGVQQRCVGGVGGVRGLEPGAGLRAPLPRHLRQHRAPGEHQSEAATVSRDLTPTNQRPPLCHVTSLRPMTGRRGHLRAGREDGLHPGLLPRRPGARRLLLGGRCHHPLHHEVINSNSLIC